MKKIIVIKKFKEYPRKLRIISGKFKSRVIKLDKSFSPRPTISFFRETLFNWLSMVIQNSVCLDCYSGTGILSIEAVSRQAKHVTSIEFTKKLVNNIKKYLNLLKINNVKLVYKNTLLWLKRKATVRYDIVFIDPPFYMGLVQKTINLLEINNWLNEKSYIYIEQENSKKKLDVPDSWFLHKEKITKKVVYRLYRRS